MKILGQFKYHFQIEVYNRGHYRLVWEHKNATNEMAQQQIQKTYYKFPKRLIRLHSEILYVLKK